MKLNMTWQLSLLPKPTAKLCLLSRQEHVSNQSDWETYLGFWAKIERKYHILFATGATWFVKVCWKLASTTNWLYAGLVYTWLIQTNCHLVVDTTLLIVDVMLISHREFINWRQEYPSITLIGDRFLPRKKARHGGWFW